MMESELAGSLLAGAAVAPFAFGLGFVVRDGRGLLTGILYLILAAGSAALVCWFTGALIGAVVLGLTPVALLAHARFAAAHRAPALVPGSPPVAAEAAAAETVAPAAEATPDALHLGMAFVGDVLETADRIGELRHKRRMRQLQRQQAERQAAAAASPRERRMAVEVKRDGPLWERKRLPPPE